MKQFIKSIFDISFKNWPTLLLFNILYKGLCYSTIYSIISNLLSLTLKSIEVSYLSTENLYLVLTNPIAIILCICMIVLVTASVIFETIALYTYCEAGWQQERLSILTLLKRTVLHGKKLLNISNIVFFLGFTVMILLTVLPFSPYILQWLSIPEFIMEVITQNSLLLPIYVVVVLAATLVCLLFLFILPYMLFHNKTIKMAWKDGMALLKKRKIVSIAHLLGAFLVFGAVMLALLSLAILGLVVYTKLVESPAEAVAMFTLNFKRAFPVVILILSTLTTIWLFSVLLTLFHRYHEDIRPARVPRAKNGIHHLIHHVKNAAIILSVALVLIIFSETELGGSVLYQTYSNPEVVAHRGGAKFTPENTMSAVDNAISMGIDTIEIDVQQLRDGSLILLHDDNFNRIAGHNKKVWEVDYSEVQTYDAGSWFSPEFIGEPIPTLDAVLQRAKDNIRVMIELKLTGHEKNLVEQVIDIIEKHDILNQCLIGSLNLEILKEANAINPKIETVYITPFIFSGQYSIDFIDAFSVETTSMTREMVTTMHMQKKKVYGWTANSKETIQKNLRCQVDGIVTDNPEMVKCYTKQAWENRLLDTIIQKFFNEVPKSEFD